MIDFKKEIKHLVALSEQKIKEGGYKRPGISSIQIVSNLETPAFFMNVPFQFNNDSANNVWIKELEGTPDLIINKSRAMEQWKDLYNYIASDSMVELCPNPLDRKLQDLVFMANAGIVLIHLNKNVVILSNFRSPARFGEVQINYNFFTSLGYDVYVPPFEWEGEAELKWLHHNVYIGGYGQRSQMEVYDWFEKNFDMKVIRVNMKDEYLYHLDCSIFPITTKETLVCRKLFKSVEIAEIKAETELIEIGKDECYNGITNSVRLGNSILNASYIDELTVGTEDYYMELTKNRTLEDIANELGMAVVYFNLSEYFKGGALLSCLVMHGNRVSFDFITV